MATINFTREELPGGAFVYTWTPLTEADTATDVTLPGAPDKTVHVFGTFGVGGTIVMEGSLESTITSRVTLTDAHGNAVSYTAASIDSLTENTLHVRPRVSAGTGVSVTVKLMTRKP